MLEVASGLFVFVEQGVKINTEHYINDILIPAFDKLKKYFKDQPFTFKQDGTPSHTSRKTQNWCQRHFLRFWSEEMRPPASPDLNYLDFSVWSSFEAKFSFKCCCFEDISSE